MIWTSSIGSAIAGYMSILFWLVVFIPQLQENYRRKNGDGLSLTFLLIWLAGDVFNLAGIIMEKLMLTMFLLALWYTVADIGLIWQVVYYQQCVTVEINCDKEEAIIVLSPRKPLTQRRVSLEKSVSSNVLERQASVHDALLYDDENHADVVNDDGAACDNDAAASSDRDIFTVPPKIKPIWINLLGASVLIMLTVTSCYGYRMTTTRLPAIHSKEDEEIQWMPQILGWMSAVLYVGSRIPQLIKNWHQQSTDGLSPGMFVYAVCGNICFSLSIFLKSVERRYIIINLPWIVGSLGTVIFDIMIFLQFCVFRRRRHKHRAD
ncbi:PQ loop repeat-domain-containing protein [Parasitella parasitica]|nr:PQ loop repeat-domain-containing protein [Parasitella parasitica]